MKTNFARFTLALFLVASTAYGMNAPDFIELSKVQSGDGAGIAGLPATQLPQFNQNPPAKCVKGRRCPPPQPTINLAPMPVMPSVVYFRNGNKIPVNQAIDGHFTGPADPRAADGYATCTLNLGRATIPMGGVLEQDPEVQTGTADLSNGMNPAGPFIKVQRAVFNFATYDQWNTVSHSQLVCYKVSRNPNPRNIATGDIRQIIGPNFQIQLGQSQSNEYAAQMAERGVVGLGGGRAPFGAGISDQPGIKGGVYNPGVDVQWGDGSSNSQTNLN